MRTKLPLFLKWGIRFEKPLRWKNVPARKVHYADLLELEQEILQRSCAYDEDDFAEFQMFPVMTETEVRFLRLCRRLSRSLHMPLRTD